MVRRRVLALLLSTSLSFLSCKSTDFGTPGGGNFANPPLTEMAMSSAASLNGEIFVTGAQTENSSGDIDIFDAISGTRTVAKLSQPRSFLALVSVDTKMYFVGGLTSGHPSDVIDIYDSNSGQWTVGHLQVPRSDPSTAVAGNKLIVAGGYEERGSGELTALATADVINLETGDVHSFALSAPRDGVALAAVGSKVYVTGGQVCYMSYRSPCDAASTMDVYDADADSVTSAAMPHARAQHRAVALGGKIYVSGGHTFAGDLSTLDIFDTDSGLWTSLPVPAGGSGSAVAVLDPYVIFAGGAGANAPGEIIVLDSRDNTLRTYPYSRYNFGASVVGSKVYLGGGIAFGNGGLETIDSFDPQTGSLVSWKAR